MTFAGRGRFPVVAKELRTLDGIVFDSRREMQRYAELKLLERGGLIHDLQCHPTFAVRIDGKHFCKFSPDYRYLTEQGVPVYEDVKSSGTQKDAAYRLRKKAFELFYRVKVTEVIRK